MEETRKPITLEGKSRDMKLVANQILWKMDLKKTTKSKFFLFDGFFISWTTEKP